jgi:RNA polymerase sigma-70 factor (ECF subfamily)
MTPTELEAQLRWLHKESFGWALHCCGRDEPEAEDVLQTVYVKVLSGRARFEGRSAFRTWLFGVIRRTAQESRRRERTREAGAARFAAEGWSQGSGDVEQERIRAESSRRLLAALERLSERQREVLHLVFYQDLTIEEAADVMDVSLGSARTHYARGKARLRSVLEEEERERPAAGR